MRKKRYSHNVGILLSDETFEQLVAVTDHLEITVSEFICDLVEKRLKRTMKEINYNDR